MSATEPRERLPHQSVQTSLRTKLTVGIALPILLVLIGLALTHYLRERQLLQEQIKLTVAQLGEVMISSLRHTMLNNNSEVLTQNLHDMGDLERLQQVQIVGLDWQVKAASDRDQVGRTWRMSEEGCVECHRLPAGSLPRAARLSTPGGALRIAVPISNDADCLGCHAREDSYLGVLLADVSVVDIESRLRRDLEVDLALSLGITLLVTLGVYFLIDRLVVRRVEALHRPLANFAAGDFSSRLPQLPGPTDELHVLASTVNQMADELQRRAQEREERNRLRQRAVAEERRRIARELHDGLAQLLGYVNTKALAVRLMLQSRELEAAEQTLLQLEEAARGLFGDVRKAIAELAVSGQETDGLATALRECTARFSRLNGLPVHLTLAPGVEDLTLEAEDETHLLRIVQEALTNARKHASATSACVSLKMNGAALELAVRDDGVGFDPERVQSDGHPRFGLKTMRERAAEIGAELTLKSAPGAGTTVALRLPLHGLSRAQ